MSGHPPPGPRGRGAPPASLRPVDVREQAALLVARMVWHRWYDDLVEAALARYGARPTALDADDGLRPHERVAAQIARQRARLALEVLPGPPRYGTTRT